MERKNKGRRVLKWIILVIGILFFVFNLFLASQVYSSTHYTIGTKPNTFKSFSEVPTVDLLRMLIFGIEIARPETNILPCKRYETIKIDAGNGKNLSAWVIRTDSVSKGTIIYFHGYRGEKSMLLDYAYETLEMGYDAVLVDFMGSADSYGNQTTIGYKEAENIKVVVDYVSSVFDEKNIYLLGFSLGGAAILKAQYDYNLPVKGIMVEASYGKMLDTVRVRISKTGVLSLPLAYLITFWGSLLNGIDGFNMNPEKYAKSVKVPTMVSCGGQDQYIPQTETQRIFDSLGSDNKVLKFYPNCIHEPYFEKYSKEWRMSVENFLNNIN